MWRAAFGIELDEWQDWLLRHLLELYPEGHPKAGHLRHRQGCISVGRQNGKTELGAILGIYGLLRQPGSLTIGIASNADQARLIYDRARNAVLGHPSMAKRFTKATETRGLKAIDGSRYEIKASKSSALQGLPIHTGLVDELHLLTTTDLWTDLVNGCGGRPNTLVAGLTTAGSDDSAQLKLLYEQGYKSIALDPVYERFFFAVWQAPEARIPEDDDTLKAYLIAANPSLAQGRADIDAIINEVRAQQPADAVRYKLNRFVASKDSFLDMGLWGACQREMGEKFPAGRVVFCIDRTPDWGYATVAAARLEPDGTTHTELVAWFTNPDLEQLVRVCESLARHAPITFAMENYPLKILADELKMRGLPTTVLTPADIVNASNLFYAKVTRRQLRHAGDPLLSVQLPRTVRVARGDSFRISRKDSSIEIDSVMATVQAVFIAETAESAPEVQIW